MKKNTIITIIVVLAIAARILSVVMSEREKAAKANSPETTTAQPAAQPPTPSSPKPDAPKTDAAKPAPTKPLTPPSTTPPATTGTLRLGTWNIEWLGQPGKRSGKGQGFAQTPDDLADYIAVSKVSILALEEILATGGSSPLRSKELDAAFATLKSKSGESWQYVLNPGKGNPDDQLTGIAWNTARAKPIDAQPWKLPIKSGQSSQGSGLWNRPPHAMKFSLGEGKTDIVVIVLHMKADYNGDFATQRDEEAKALTAALPAVETKFKDKDIVLLGDTNVTKPNEPCVVDIQNAGFTDLNPKNEQTHWRGGATDRIFTPASQPEFKSHVFEVMSDRYLEPKRWQPSDFKQKLSDHYMAVTTIAVQDDDD